MIICFKLLYSRSQQQPLPRGEAQMCGQGQCDGQGGCGKGGGGCHGQKAQQAFLGDSGFPVHFQNDRLTVYSNSSGEVFVRSVGNQGSVVRIGAWGQRRELEITASADADLRIGVSAVGKLPCVEVVTKK